MTVVKKSAKRALLKEINLYMKNIGISHHGYTYNKNVITNLFNRGSSRELKGGYKL
jgi:hypothetical protein